MTRGETKVTRRDIPDKEKEDTVRKLLATQSLR